MPRSIQLEVAVDTKISFHACTQDQWKSLRYSHHGLDLNCNVTKDNSPGLRVVAFKKRLFRVDSQN